jgi:hypothetical protein
MVNVTLRREGLMTGPKVNPGPAADSAPTADIITDYDRRHLITYLMLLDAMRDGIDPSDCAREILQIDPVAEPDRARRSYESHLARAQWISRSGHRQLLNDPKLRQP